MRDVYALLMQGDHLATALEVVASHPAVAGIVVAADEDEIPRAQSLLANVGTDQPSGVVLGAQRGEAIHQGLRFLRETCSDDDVVLLHDASEAALTAAALDRCVHAARASGSVVTAVPLAGDVAIVRSSEPGIDLAPAGAAGRVTFPQAFGFERIWSLYDWAFGAAGGVITDPYHWCLVRLRPAVVFGEER